MKRKLSITVRGIHHQWSFHFEGDRRHLQEWRDDGLEIYEIYNTIPEWVAGLGLTRPWCFIQDVFNFRNPWST